MNPNFRPLKIPLGCPICRRRNRALCLVLCAPWFAPGILGFLLGLAAFARADAAIATAVALGLSAAWNEPPKHRGS